ncbi:MAG: lysine exporter LysO family protein [Candidatus Methanomethylicia archaeon]
MRAIHIILTLISGIVIGVLNQRIGILIQALDSILFILILQIGIEVGLKYKDIMRSIKKLKNQLHLPIITIISSIIAGIISSKILNIDTRIVLAISLGMGWYSFTGAYLTLKLNPYYGAIAFASNMLREAATIIITPILPRKFKRAGVIIGGATTMDTTLPIIVKEFGEEEMILALYHGLIITLIIPIILSTII